MGGINPPELEEFTIGLTTVPFIACNWLYLLKNEILHQPSAISMGLVQYNQHRYNSEHDCTFYIILRHVSHVVPSQFKVGL